MTSSEPGYISKDYITKKKVPFTGPGGEDVNMSLWDPIQPTTGGKAVKCAFRVSIRSNLVNRGTQLTELERMRKVSVQLGHTAHGTPTTAEVKLIVDTEVLRREEQSGLEINI